MAMTAERLVGARAGARSGIYFWMAVAMAATGLLGFAPTFWIPLAHGHHTGPVIAIHGGLMTLWMLFFVFQTWLVNAGDVARHRALGLLGISLATLVVVFGVLAAIDQSHRAALAGNLPAGFAFMIVPMTTVVMYGGFTAAAVVNIRRSEWHKRLMLVGTASVMSAPVARPFAFFLGMQGHLPVPAGMPSPPRPVDGLSPDSFVALLFIVVPLIHDWRARGRPHPAYWLALAVHLAVRVAMGPLSTTPAWQAVAHFVYSLAG